MKTAGKWKRIAGKTLTWLFCIPVFAVFFASGCMTFRTPDRKAIRQFGKLGIRLEIIRYASDCQEMHAAAAGSAELGNVLFIHGSPGSWNAFEKQMQDSLLLRKFRMYSADRPGCGYSGHFGEGEPSLNRQVESLVPLMRMAKSNGKPLFLCGHSLGGPIAALAAMKHPELVDGLVIAAGSIDPELEPHEPWRKPMRSQLLRWLLPASFRASNDELAGLKTELQTIIPEWKQIRCPVTVVHGTKDILVPYGNAAFARKMLSEDQLQVITLENENHFFVWTRPEILREALISLPQRLH